jgi:hypothetical protein
MRLNSKRILKSGATIHSSSPRQYVSVAGASRRHCVIARRSKPDLILEAFHMDIGGES